MPHSYIVTCLAAFVFTVSLNATAADSGWPFIRGPEFDGHSSESGVANSWPAAGPPVLWTRELGQGYSGFVAWKDRVATQMQSFAGQYVVCLDAATGNKIWQYRYEWPYEPAGVYPGPRATPTYDDGRIYFAAPSGLVGCLKAADGDLLWSVNLKEKYDGKGTGFGYSCSPTVVDGKVIMPVGGEGASMVALDAKSGSIVWKAGDEPASYSPAYPITFRGQRLVIGYLQNTMECHDLETGELVWSRELSRGYDEHSAWPIYSEPYLWISGPFQAGSELLELTGDAEHPLKTVWKSNLMSNDIFSSVLVGGALYGFDLREAQAKVHRPSRGQFRCLDFLTGEEQWSTGDARPRRTLDTVDEDIGKRIGHANVVVADGKLILLNDTGELILARVNKERFEELGRIRVLGGELCWTQPTLYRGRLFVRNQSRAACLYLGEPKQLKTTGAQSTMTVADIPQSEYIDWAGLILGVEPEYAFDIPSDEWFRRWFFISLFGVLGTSFGIAVLLGLVLRKWMKPTCVRWMFWILAFVLGAAGTTVISRWLNDFVFTWQVSIFVAFQATVYELNFSREQDAAPTRWRGRIVALLFIACCVVYFLICRRLSLVFEWVFLCGFGAALPLAMMGAMAFRKRRWRILWECTLTVAAFAAFYWSAVWILMLKSV